MSDRTISAAAAKQAVAIRARLPMPAEAGASGITPQQWRVLTDAIFPSAKTPESICMALDYCRARGLDVFKRPVHIVPMWNSTLRREVETVWPGINELQVTAARSKLWAGMDEPKWGPEKTKKWQTMKGTVEVTFPEWCSITVYRLVSGEKCAFSEPVYWLEAYAHAGRDDAPNSMWQKRTRGQLHKVAKAASLRAAFPEDVGNDYAAEEMEGKEIHAGGIVIDGTAETVSPGSSQEPGDDMPRPHEYTAWVEEREAELTAESNGPKWLVLLKVALTRAPSADAVKHLMSTQTVLAGKEAAPRAIREDIDVAAAAALRRIETPPRQEEVHAEPVGDDEKPAAFLLYATDEFGDAVMNGSEFQTFTTPLNFVTWLELAASKSANVTALLEHNADAIDEALRADNSLNLRVDGLVLKGDTPPKKVGTPQPIPAPAKPGPKGWAEYLEAARSEIRALESPEAMEQWKDRNLGVYAGNTVEIGVNKALAEQSLKFPQPDRDAVQAEGFIADIKACKTRDALTTYAANGALRTVMARWKTQRPELFEKVDRASEDKLAEFGGSA